MTFVTVFAGGIGLERVGPRIWIWYLVFCKSDHIRVSNIPSDFHAADSAFPIANVITSSCRFCVDALRLFLLSRK